MKPPQTIIRFPVHTAVCPYRGDGAFTVEVGVQKSTAAGLASVYPAASKDESPGFP